MYGLKPVPFRLVPYWKAASSLRLILCWNRRQPSGSSCFGINSTLQAHLVLEESPGCVAKAHLKDLFLVATMVLHFLIQGRVQGVGFRWYVHREASELELRGWVRNTEDGEVEVVAAGDPEGLTELRASLH